MFRATVNPFDDVVSKATDENLTSENWEFIMEAVDKVDASGETGPRDVVAALIKRLAYRNPNVQIYTLETANALSQNCGLKIHQELASNAFVDTLKRLMAAPTGSTPFPVKAKILERMEEWTEMFSYNPNLSIMEKAYLDLKRTYPNLQPETPLKNAMSDVDRRKEEEDLARALEISLRDTRIDNNFATPSSSNNPSASQQQKPSGATPAPAPVNATAATVSRVRALFDFIPTETGELEFRKGDVIAVLESVYKDWWKGSLRGQIGIFPLNYVEKLADPTPAELQREAELEAEVFGQIKNVEKLLSLLSTSSADQKVDDNEEITTLYHQTLAIRPKLIDLISKYQQKRDDFSALNEKFVKARRDYEALLDTSMSQPPTSHYPQPYNNYPLAGPPSQGYYPPGSQSQLQQPPQHSGAHYPPQGPANTLPYPLSDGPPQVGGGTAPYETSSPVGRQRMNSGPSDPYGGQPQELATSPHETAAAAEPAYKSYYTYQAPVGGVPPGAYRQMPDMQGGGRPNSYSGPSAPPAGNNPQDFYRTQQSELFLPGGGQR